MERADVPRALAVSWSDPAGRDGVAADLRTFGAFGVHAAAVVTGIGGVPAPGSRPAPLPAAFVDGQIDAAVASMGPSPVKVSVLGHPEADGVLAARLQALKTDQLVLDLSPLGSAGAPVTGTPGQPPAALYKTVLPALAAVLLVDVATAEALAGIKIKNQTALRAAAKLLHRLGPRYVLVMGAQLPDGEPVDILFDGRQVMDYPGERLPLPEPPGASSTYASAIAAGLAHGRSVEEAVAVARIYVTEAVRNAYSTGGVASANQLYAWWAAGGSNGYGA